MSSKDARLALAVIERHAGDRGSSVLKAAYTASNIARSGDRTNQKYRWVNREEEKLESSRPYEKSGSAIPELMRDMSHFMYFQTVARRMRY